MSAPALFVSSTRNAMRPSEPIERDTRQLRATRAHICESAVQRFDRFDPLEELLSSLRHPAPPPLRAR
jgi:hypothetical protein